MEAQKCKICGARHHRYEPHVFSAETEAEVANDILFPCEPIPIEPKQEGQVGPRPPLKLPDHPEALKQAHNAFMREYMRKRRAKLKE